MSSATMRSSAAVQPQVRTVSQPLTQKNKAPIAVHDRPALPSVGLSYTPHPSRAKQAASATIIAVSDDDYPDEDYTSTNDVSSASYGLDQQEFSEGLSYGPWHLVQYDDTETIYAKRFVRVVSDGEVIDYCVEQGPARLDAYGEPIEGGPDPELTEPSADCDRLFEQYDSE